MNSFHTPVLAKEVIDFLKPQSDKTYIDATLGNGGHTIKLLQAGATVYGIDLDPKNLAKATKRIKSVGLSKNFIGINDNFSNIKNIHKKTIKKPVDGILFDLGLSQNQQKSTNRGFSFNDDLSLDMRINPNTQAITADHIVNTYSQQQLFEIFSKYSQDKFSQPISHLIVNTRKNHPIHTAKKLSDLIQDYYKSRSFQGRLHPATKIFLSLKIAVNSELTNLSLALNDSLNLIKKDAYILIITFHSTEDRLVKNFIRNCQKDNTIKNSIKIKPTFTEIKANPLSRSALLRAFQIS